MNENLNLVEILKDCPLGIKLYSTVFGDVEFYTIIDNKTIIVTTETDDNVFFSAYGKMYTQYNGECLLFPSRDQRDWSKFKPKKPKFDPKTLQPFDRVLARDGKERWCCDLFSNLINVDGICQYLCVGSVFEYCIPYNDDTKHLIGTSDEAPEFYRYWEE